MQLFQLKKCPFLNQLQPKRLPKTPKSEPQAAVKTSDSKNVGMIL